MSLPRVPSSPSTVAFNCDGVDFIASQGRGEPSSPCLHLIMRIHLARIWVPSPRYLSYCSPLRNVGPALQDAKEIEEILVEPSWSVKALFNSKKEASSMSSSVSCERLHHLLRLSALPLPTSATEEAAMLKDLELQLCFVSAIQRVDTADVQPLVSIRNETEEGYGDEAITLDALKEDLAKEEAVGTRGRIRRSSDGKVGKDDAENWDPLASAPSTKGRFIALDTRKA